MPQAVTHILVPLLIMSIIRDYVLSKNAKAHFPLHYVFIAGLAGALPDIDIGISFVLNFLGVSAWNIHKTFTHTFFFPLIFFIGFIIFRRVHTKAHICNLGRHKMRLSLIFLMISFGTLTHVLLDAFFGNHAFLFYPFVRHDFGFDAVSYLPSGLQGYFLPTMDGVFLIIWLVYLELKHRISDFI